MAGEFLIARRAIPRVPTKTERRKEEERGGEEGRRN